MTWNLQILDQVDDLLAAEDLQRQIWTGSETDIVPLHLLMTLAHNGGLIIGAFEQDSHPPAGVSSQDVPPHRRLVGLVFGFAGLYFTPDGPRPKHCSHMLGVHPEYRGRGLGFALKRAQWQMVRQQGLDLITWTFDPLLSRNAHLNMARLGAVCNIYRQNLYGELRDEMNAGLPSDRFQVDWWVNTRRVNRRLSKQARRPLDLAHCLAAGAQIINPSQTDGVWPRPPQTLAFSLNPSEKKALVLVEIPADFLALKAAEASLALAWRIHTRALFEDLFTQGYLVTDFVHLSGNSPRGFYVLSHGESTL